MKTKLIALTLATLAFSSCGKKEEFKYNLTENGCSTGDKSFESKEAMCTGLKDSGANNGCAYSLRKQKYQEDSCGSWASVRNN
jgi:hypothetical protein